jgi:molecular chaperone Hsp33
MSFASDANAEPDDRVRPFTVDSLDLRGRIARLGPAIDELLSRHDYPPQVSRVVGEAAVLTVLLGTALKFEGRFQLQTKSEGPIGMVVVDFEAPDKLRALARFDAERLAEMNASGIPDTGALLGEGFLAMTIDQSPDMARYQGVVSLSGGSFEDAAHQYFTQSEQIPTRVRLAVAEAVRGGELGARRWRAGGLLVQFFPDSAERARLADLSGGDAPEGYEEGDGPEDDAWVEARSLMATVEDHELTDPTLAPERLLIRLFNEHEVRVFDDQPIREACRCSRARIFDMLRSFPPDDRKAMIADDGSITVTCEFCNRSYAFEPAEVEEAASEPERTD